LREREQKSFYRVKRRRRTQRKTWGLQGVKAKKKKRNFINYAKIPEKTIKKNMVFYYGEREMHTMRQQWWKQTSKGGSKMAISV
jgi:hypothetical protein